MVQPQMTFPALRPVYRLTVPESVLDVTTELLSTIAGGCTVDETKRQGYWKDAAGHLFCEPVRQVEVSTTAELFSTIRQRYLDLTGELALFCEVLPTEGYVWEGR